MIELGYNYLHWFKRHYFLYIFGFLLYFQPIEPFYREMVVTTKNITEQEFDMDIRPLAAYSTVICALLIFFLLIFSNFHYVLFLSLLASLVYTVSSWKGEVVTDLQISQVFYGAGVSTEVIYFASIYVCYGTTRNFPKLTCAIRAVPLCTKIVSAVVACVLTEVAHLNYEEVAFISLPTCVHAFFLLMHLPPMFELEEPPSSLRAKISWFKSRFIETFANKHILKWSLWSGFALCGYVRISGLMESLWEQTQQQNKEPFLNIAGIDGISAFFALIGVLLARNSTGSAKFGNALLCITSILECVILIALSNVENVWSYAICDILLEIVYQLVMASVSVMIAQSVEQSGSFALVFGFIGVIFAISNLVFVCVFNSRSINLKLGQQLMILAGFHVANGALVVLFWLLKM